MTTRSARIFAGMALAVAVTAANARADFNPFGAYWENVARAAARNDAYAVQRMVGTGDNPDQVDDNGRTGLQIAAISGNTTIAAILIKADAHLNYKDPLGNTALHYAVERNHPEMVRLLLDAGAAVDPENKGGMTPLMLAARRGNLTMVRLLLAKGASVHKSDFTGRDALSWAQDSRRSAVVEMLQRAAAKR